MLNRNTVLAGIAALVLAACGAQAPVQAPNSAAAPQAEAAAVSTAADLQSTLVSLYEQANPAVVYILVPPVGSGSGFLYDESGHIVTNNHVVEDGETFEVVFADGTRTRADLVGRDADSDLAVLKVDEVPTGTSPLPLAEAEGIRVGQFVVAIGNPFGEQGSMSLGIISGLGRSLASQRLLETGSTYSLPGVIQTDAPINPGNSGGPLLNLQGEVVGVNAAINTVTGTGSGVGFSVPVGAVARIVPSLITEGSYTYPFMGVSFDNEVSLAEQGIYGVSQTQGAYVVSVVEGGPGDEAGLIAADEQTRAGGDLIIELDGQPIRNFADLNSYLVFNTEPGQTITITALRDGEPVTLELTLGERP